MNFPIKVVGPNGEEIAGCLNHCVKISAKLIETLIGSDGNLPKGILVLTVYAPVESERVVKKLLRQGTLAPDSRPLLLDWERIRDYYVKGKDIDDDPDAPAPTKSPTMADCAERFGTTLDIVKNHAAKEKWTELRREWQREQDENYREKFDRMLQAEGDGKAEFLRRSYRKFQQMEQAIFTKLYVPDGKKGYRINPDLDPQELKDLTAAMARANDQQKLMRGIETRKTVTEGKLDDPIYALLKKIADRPPIPIIEAKPAPLAEEIAEGIKQFISPDGNTLKKTDDTPPAPAKDEAAPVSDSNQDGN